MTTSLTPSSAKPGKKLALAITLLSTLLLAAGFLYAFPAVFHLPRQPFLPLLILLVLGAVCAVVSGEIEHRHGKNASAKFDIVFAGVAAAILAWGFFAILL